MSDEKTQDEVLRLAAHPNVCPACGAQTAQEGPCLACKELPPPDTTLKAEAFREGAEPTDFGGRLKRLDIPTYDPDGPVEYDWGRAGELTLADELGLRVIMGDATNRTSPSVCVERAVDRWRLFVHIDGGDPFCYIEITDTEAVLFTDRIENVIRQERIV